MFAELFAIRKLFFFQIKKLRKLWLFSWLMELMLDFMEQKQWSKSGSSLWWPVLKTVQEEVQSQFMLLDFQKVCKLLYI